MTDMRRTSPRVAPRFWQTALLIAAVVAVRVAARHLGAPGWLREVIAAVLIAAGVITIFGRRSRH